MNDPSVRIYLPRRCDVLQTAISPPVAAMTQDDDPAAPDIRIRPRQATGRSALVLTIEVDVGAEGTQRYDLCVDTNGKPSLRSVKLADTVAPPAAEPAEPASVLSDASSKSAPRSGLLETLR